MITIYDVIVTICVLVLNLSLAKMYGVFRIQEIKKLKSTIQIMDSRCTRYLREYSKLFERGSYKLQKPNYNRYIKVCRHWEQERLSKIQFQWK